MNTIAVLPLFLGNLRGAQLLIVVALLLLLFGSKKIPELMRGLGKGVHAFKQGLADAQEEINKPVDKNNTAADNAADNDKNDAKKA